MNVLVSAALPDHADHAVARAWLDQVLADRRPFAVSELVLSAAVRLLTNPRVVAPPLAPTDALSFVAAMRDGANAVVVAPGRGHWPLFDSLCRTTGASANDVPDAYLAALAIDSGSELVTFDRGFARFPGLRWHTPTALVGRGH